MQLEEIKVAVGNLSAEERRKLALYILDLEKEHLRKNVGPQLSEDVESVTKAIQDGIEKLKKFVNKA